MPFQAVASVRDLWIGEMAPYEVCGRAVLLVRLPEGIVAYQDRCAHLRFPLSRGALDGCVLTCSAHGYTFDASTGRGINPNGTALESFPVRLEGDRILVDVTTTPNQETA